MAPSHHVGNFLPKTKGFFPHDFTLIASVVGESVIGHGIGRKDIPIMVCLAKGQTLEEAMTSLSVITRSRGLRVMAQRSKYVYATYYGKILQNPR